MGKHLYHLHTGPIKRIKEIATVFFYIGKLLIKRNSLPHIPIMMIVVDGVTMHRRLIPTYTTSGQAL